ncbi:MAG: replication factor C large subunit [Candidatus Woesearchaeota archaeon]
MRPWTEKYRPLSPKDVAGQDSAVNELKRFVANHKTGKVALLFGPTGTGKTCSVYAIAKDFNYEVLELNASDKRNKKSVNELIGSSSQQMSLFAKGKIILVDEVEGLSGNADRGGASEALKLALESKWPVVMATSNFLSDKLKDIRKKSTMIEFLPLDYKSMLPVLEGICAKENISYNPDAIKSLARLSGGDIRAAINDLQMLSSSSKKIESIEELGERDVTGTMQDALCRIFKCSKAEDVLRVFDNVNADHRECMMWVDENLPKEYSDDDLINAYDKLSRADVFNGRIRRWQHWRFLVYIYNLLTAGIALSKTSKNPKAIEYKRSGRILKLWQAKMKYAKKKAIAEKIAAKNHVSSKRAYTHLLPYFQIIMQHNPSSMAEEFNLTPEEASWLSSPRT